MSELGDPDSHHNVEDSSFQSGTSPFFADATLDLDTAHDLAETPDASRSRRQTVAANDDDADAPLLPSAAGEGDGSVDDAAPDDGDGGGAAVVETPRRRVRPEEPPSDASPSVPTGFSGTPEYDENVETPERREMTRITHMDASRSGVPHSLRRMRLLWSSLPRTRPTWPRDWAWALAFVVVVPLALAGPLCLAQPRQYVWTQPPLSTATFGAWIVSAGAAVLVTRWMYGRRWNDEDRTGRHERVAAGLVSFAAWSVVVYLVLAVTIFIRLPAARWTTVLPLAYTVRDVYLVRRWKQRRNGGGVTTRRRGNHNNNGMSRLSSAASQASQPTSASSSSASSYASRYAFFQALTAMALEILAQSLRRASFFRVLTLILVTQTLVIGLWRQALIGALDDESVWLLLLAALGGKWATGTMARLLSLVASGGVVNWFVKQQEDFPDDNEEEDYGDIELSAASDSQVPEAYRTVGASVYQSVLRMDDALDDDDDDDLAEEGFRQEYQAEHSGRVPAGSDMHPESLSTVRGMVSAGLSVSFGSVAMCGLLGGPAQFVWSQIRKVNIWQQGHEPTESIVEKTWNRVLLWARSFVRSHSDLAMSHVAAYYKPYPRAARDVARLVEEAGGAFSLMGGM